MYKLFLLSALLMLGACKNDVPTSCPAMDGVFVAEYRWLDGSCGTFQANSLTMAEEDHGTVTKIENRLSNTITTQVIFRGCTLGITQSVSAGGLKSSEIAGDLKVQGALELEGMMTRTEYKEDGSMLCNAVYDAHYTRQDAIAGGAVDYADSH